MTHSPTPGPAGFDSQALDGTVLNLYRAATNGAPWDSALEATCAALGADAFALQILDRRTGELLGLHHGSTELPTWTNRHLRSTVPPPQRRPEPPTAVMASTAAVGLGRQANWSHGSHWLDLHPASQAPSPKAHCAVLVEPDRITGFALTWPQGRGPLEGEDTCLVERMGAHLRDALLLHARLRGRAPGAVLGQHLMASSTKPVWLLGAQASVLFANAAAVAALAQGTLVRCVSGALQLAAPSGADDLATHLQQRVDSMLATGGAPRTIVALGGASEGSQRAPAHLLLQRLAAATAGIPSDCSPAGAAIMATLYDLDRPFQPDAAVLSSVFGLTPAESRVALLVVRGLTASEIASELHVMPTTIRTHVKQLLAKLGVRRRVDAIRMLSQACSLLQANEKPGPKE